MFGDIEHALRNDLRDREYAEEYAGAFLNSFIATQIKVIREQRGMTQAELGSHIGTTQAGVSRYEDVNYSSWSLRTLMKLARAFDVRLRVSFEPYGTLPDEVIRFDRQRLETIERDLDPRLMDFPVEKEQNSYLPVDIRAYKALAQIGQREERQDKDSGREESDGSGRNSESKSTDDDRVGRSMEPRKNPPIGLYSAISSAV